MEYDEIVDAIKDSLDLGIDARFRVGRLVDQLMEATERGFKGEVMERLAVDVGVKASTLNAYRRVYEFWGSARVPSFHSWSDYQVIVMYWQHRYPDSIVLDVRTRLVDGEDPTEVWDSVRQWYVAPTPRYSVERDARSLVNRMAYLTQALSPAPIAGASEELRQDLFDAAEALIRAMKNVGLTTESGAAATPGVMPRTFGGIKVGN